MRCGVGTGTAVVCAGTPAQPCSRTTVAASNNRLTGWNKVGVGKSREDMARDYILPARGPTSDAAGRENAYMLPVPRALAKTLGLKAGDVLGMMVVLSDMAPAAKGSLILERIPSVRGKRARR